MLDLFVGGPYIFGCRYRAVVQDAGGVKRVNRAFAAPPTSEEQIIDPVAARDSRAPKRSPLRRCAATSDVTAGSTTSVRSHYLVLASRIDPEVAFTAAEGRGGDRYVGYAKRGTGGRECVRVAFRGDTTDDTEEIGDAFEEWSAALPDGAAPVCRGRGSVTLTACDVGGVAAPSEETLNAALELLVNRNDVASSSSPPTRRRRAPGAPPTSSPATRSSLRCWGKDAKFEEDEQQRFDTLIIQAITGCRST